MRVIRCRECDRMYVNPQEGEACPYDGARLVDEVPREEVGARLRQQRRESTPYPLFPQLGRLTTETRRLAEEARTAKEEARQVREKAHRDREERRGGGRK